VLTIHGDRLAVTAKRAGQDQELVRTEAEHAAGRSDDVGCAVERQRGAGDERVVAGRGHRTVAGAPGGARGGHLVADRIALGAGGVEGLEVLLVLGLKGRVRSSALSNGVFDCGPHAASARRPIVAME
jgi:hypothetical protein